MESEDQHDDDFAPRTSIVEPGDINEAERTIMRADVVGDTAYSTKWILKVLISLSKLPDDVEWSDEMEENLCYLWDMTAEKDVVLFLIRNEFISIGEYVLSVSTEPRLTEIIIGIIGNLCCQSEVLPEIAGRSELVQSLMNLLICDDTETLIQLLRILQAAVWNLQSDTPCNEWLNHLRQCKFLGNVLTFILQSSTSDILLRAALNLLQSVTQMRGAGDSFFEEKFEMKPLLSALVEAFIQLIPEKSNDEAHTSAEMKITESWLEILSKILEISSSNVFDVIEDDAAVVGVLIRILEPYRYYDNLKMIALEEATVVDCIYQTVELICWFQQRGFGVENRAITIMLEIMHQLHLLLGEKNSATEETDRSRDLQRHLGNYWLKLQTQENPTVITEITKTLSESTRSYLTNYTMKNTPAGSVSKVA